MKMSLAAMLAVLVLSVAGADEVPEAKSQPISAVAVSECGKAIVVFVTVDATHLLRLDSRSATVFTVKPDGSVEEAASEPIEIATAITIASAARLQSHVTLPCRQNVI